MRCHRFNRILDSLSRDDGFTIVELLVTIAVMGAVATVAMIAINPAKRIAEANDTQIKTDISSIRNSLEAYAAANNSRYPVTPTWWCENCTAYAAKGANNWIPELVERGFIKRLPTSPLNGVPGYPGCTAGQAAYLYYSNGTDYKLIAHCMPTTELNIGEANKGSNYCNTPPYDRSAFSDSSNPTTALKALVDPARPDYAYAVYSEGFTCF